MAQKTVRRPQERETQREGITETINNLIDAALRSRDREGVVSRIQEYAEEGARAQERRDGLRNTVVRRVDNEEAEAAAVDLAVRIENSTNGRQLEANIRKWVG
ncbi:hypothetical protein KKF81_04325 [Candidatus Micrarchaeota archaeon]|nr:hypothetical protein [Candidatus Micrarchaeota archaeon]MBU1166152.1 hypothetical protein [Candidatus Micrarchaeota archaeon]MBU1887304.1 hypothetical protein [Candidatus Micrarchaeota archaeon]